MLHGLLGSEIESVRYLGSQIQHRIEISWGDGRIAIVSVGKTSGNLPIYATLVTKTEVSHLEVDNSRLYRSLLEKVLPYLAGDTEEPVPFETLIEVELASIAATISMQKEGMRIFLKDISNIDIGYDGEKFTKGYKKKKFNRLSQS